MVVLDELYVLIQTANRMRFWWLSTPAVYVSWSEMRCTIEEGLIREHDKDLLDLL